MRSQIPPQYHENYLLTSQSIENVKEYLAFDNQYAGYVYLVDQNLKIRWAGAAFAQQREIESGRKCVGDLLQRLRESDK